MRGLQLAAACVATVACWSVATVAAGSEQRQVLLPSGHVEPTGAKYVAGSFALIDRAGHDLPGARFPSVSVLDAGGRELVVPDAETPPPDADWLWDVTITPEGILVVAATLADGGEPVLAQYDLRRGRLLRIARTGAVECRAIAADAAGVWCVGTDRGKVNEGSDDYDVIYHFSPAGERLQSLFPKRSLPRPTLAGQSDIQVVAGGGRFAAWLPGEEVLLTWGPGGSDPRQVVAHVPRVQWSDEPGSQRERAPGHLGMLADGTTVLMTYIGRDADEPRRVRRALYAVGGRGSLERLPGSCDLFPLGYRLAGIDGEQLVLLDRAGRRFVWLPVRCPEEE